MKSREMVFTIGLALLGAASVPAAESPGMQMEGKQMDTSAGKADVNHTPRCGPGDRREEGHGSDFP